MVTTSRRDMSEEVSKLLLSIGAVTFRVNPPYVYTSGIKSPIYTDNRLVISYPQVRERIVELYLEMMQEQITEKIDCVSATATAAIPWGAWIADRLHLPMVYVRSSAKAHGKENLVEGTFEKGAHVVIVEDLISTGVSSIGNAEALRQMGGVVNHIVGITTYETEASQKAFEEHSLHAHLLTTGKITLEEAIKEQKLTQEEGSIARSWFSDPMGWGEQFNK